MITVHDQDALAIANAIDEHLTKGGTHVAGQLLAMEFRNQCNAQAIAQAREKEIRDAVARSRVDDALGKKDADPILAAVPANDPAPVKAQRAARRGK